MELAEEEEADERWLRAIQATEEVALFAKAPTNTHTVSCFWFKLKLKGFWFRNSNFFWATSTILIFATNLPLKQLNSLSLTCSLGSKNWRK